MAVKRRNTLSDPYEPDPEFDEVYGIELRSTMMKEEISRYISNGVFSTKRILRKLYDPEDEHFTKLKLKQLIEQVQVDIIVEWQERPLINDIYAFLEQNEELIADMSEELGVPMKSRDKVTVVNTIAGLWKDRIEFLKWLGAVQQGGHASGRDVSEKEKARYAAFEEEANILEGEVVDDTET